MKIRTLLFASMLMIGGMMQAQNNGGIDDAMMQQIKKSYNNNGADKALRNAIVNSKLQTLAMNYENATAFNSHFSNKVNSVACTDQKSSGRCWMFTGLNVMRNKAIREHKLPANFQFSQAYLFFYDQLEKSNLFLQAIIDTRAKDMEDQEVQWLFKNPSATVASSPV